MYKLQRTVRIKRGLIKTLKEENSNFPSCMLRNCVLGGDIQEEFTKYTSNTPHLSWWHCRRDVTFTPAQNTYCVLTTCTRTTGLHIEMLINHTPNGSFLLGLRRCSNVNHVVVSCYLHHSESGGGVVEGKLPSPLLLPLN